jgi:hypothetical protein
MEYEVITNVDMRRLGEEGERIYYENLKPILEPQYKGKIVAIEVDSGDYFIGDSVIKALQKAREVYPDKLFHFMKIGFRTLRKRR